MAIPVKRTKNGGKVCAMGNCKSNGRKLPEDTPIFFIPFPKPCKKFTEENLNAMLHGTIRTHKTSDCDTCSKAQRWIYLCRRNDILLQKLDDITFSSYVCTKHFVDPEGPTTLHPDPLPANVSDMEKEKIKRTKRKPPMDRAEKLAITKKRTKDAQKTCEGHELVDESGSFSKETFDGTCSPMNSLSAPNMALQTLYSDMNDDTSGLKSGFKGLGAPNMCHASTQYSEILDIMTFASKHLKSKWAIHVSDAYTAFVLYDAQNFNHSAEIRVTCIEDKLKCSLQILGKDVLDDLGLHVQNVSNYENLDKLLNKFSHTMICGGITDEELKALYFSLEKKELFSFCYRSQAVRSPHCRLLTFGKKCVHCLMCEHKLKMTRRKHNKTMSNTHPKCNNRFLSKDKLAAKVEHYRKRSHLMEKAKNRLAEKFKKVLQFSPTVCKEDNEDLIKLLMGALKNIDESSLVRIFLRAQLQAATRKSCKGFKWHPRIIKWCLCIYKMSSCAYRAIRESGFLTLPSERLLQEFSTTFISEPGFPEKLPLNIQDVSNL